MKHVFTRFDSYLILLLGLSAVALVPLMGPGYFYGTHDGRHSVFFITMFDEAIRSGTLWPRWGMHHNMGYGYPTFLVQAPVAFYVAEIFVLMGVGVTNAAKLTWAIAIFAGAWGMYALVKRWCAGLTLMPSPAEAVDLPHRNHAVKSRISIPALCGVVAGLLYTYAPYHLLDMYVRGALAETLLMAWFPWILLAFDRLIAYGAARGWQGRLLLAAMSFAGALLTHAFALPAFTPLLVGFVLFRLWLAWYSQGGKHFPLHVRTLTHRTLLSLGSGLAGLLLAAIFLVPLVIEGQVLVLENWIRESYGYERHWVYWGQFLSPFWGYGYSDDPLGANDGMGFQQGVMLLLLGALAAYLPVNAFLVSNFVSNEARLDESPTLLREQQILPLLMLFFVFATMVILLTTTPLAAALWRLVPLLEVLQFPWRLLALSAFTLSAVGGLVVCQLSAGQQGAGNLGSREWDEEFGLMRAIPEQIAEGENSGLREEAGILTLSLMIVFASFTYSQPSSMQPIDAWREDGHAVAEFETQHPDMYGYTQYGKMPYSPSPMQAQYLAALENDEPLDRNELTRLVIRAGEGEVSEFYSLGHAFGGTVEMTTPGTVQIQLLAFPGWRVRVNGFVVDYRVSPPYGLMEIDVPAGLHTIEIWMGLTAIRLAGIATSGITLVVLVALWIRSGLRKHNVGNLAAQEPLEHGRR